ncbi:hypothetical protein AB0E69_12670 [Kribbella sp. NPDC026611]|uniref:hypothetical protein n=1 Tax=Kribbella sp. NPDC026611 TaxID=3154911 RepID=UPI0033D3663B
MPLVQSGSTSATCEARSNRDQVQAYTAATLKVTITPYAGQEAGAGNDPLTPEQIARKTFTRSPLNNLEGRPYPTKAIRAESGKAGEAWSVRVLVQRADIVVGVEYTANPITGDVAQEAALDVADRAIWESK